MASVDAANERTLLEKLATLKEFDPLGGEWEQQSGRGKKAGKKKKDQQKKAVETVESDVQIGQAAAAVRIQKLWRGFITRKFAQRKREEELIFIGMVSPT